jgi:hypothetical protein
MFVLLDGSRENGDQLREGIDSELAQTQAENKQLKVEFEKLVEEKSELQSASSTRTRSTTPRAQASPKRVPNEGSSRLVQVSQTPAQNPGR